MSNFFRYALLFLFVLLLPFPSYAWYNNATWEVIEVYYVSNHCLDCVVNYTGTFNKSDRWINVSTYSDLPFWNESTSKVWINLTGNESQIGKAINNSNSYNSISNGTITFSFFDDFLGSLIDNTKWSSNGSVVSSVSNSTLTLGSGVCNPSDNTLKSFQVFPVGYIADFSMNPGLKGGSGGCKFWGFGNGILGLWYQDIEGIYNSNSDWAYVGDGVDTSTEVDSSSWGTYTFTRENPNVSRYHKNGIERTGSPQDPTFEGSSAIDFYGGVVLYVDNVRVRKYASPVPVLVYNSTLFFSVVPSWNLTGRVTNSSGGFVSGAIVSCWGCHVTKYTLTNDSGYYNFSQMHNNFSTVLHVGLSGYNSNETLVTVSGMDVNQDFMLISGVSSKKYQEDRYMEGIFLLLVGLILVLPKIKKNFLLPCVGIFVSGWMVFNGVDHSNPQGYILTGGFIVLGCAFAISAFYSIMRKE